MTTDTGSLRCISFDQVSRIDIIRGTPSALVGIRNEGLIVNIITDNDDQISVTLEASADHFQNAHLASGERTSCPMTNGPCARSRNR